MENTEKEMSGEESILLIEQMIKTAKKDFHDSSFHYLLWGWLVFLASLSQFIMISYDYENSSIPWLLMPLGAVIATVYGIKQKKQQHVKTYVGEFIKYNVLAMAISLLIVLAMQGYLQIYTYPIVMIVYATMLFIAGGALQFRPLMIGGLINWTIAAISFNYDFKIQLLLLALAVLLGYIIPGYLLKYRKQGN
jgi:hypothetical protein